MKLIIVLIWCLVATAVPAVALADTEPNDGIGQWEGPYPGDTPVNGTFAAANDIDWYGFYAAGPADVTIPVQNTGQAGTCRPIASLRDFDGKVIASVSPESGQVATLVLNAPAGTLRYFLTLEADCAQGSYAFTLTPASAIAAGSKRETPTVAPEPNDSIGDAFGPLQGGVDFGGLLDSDGDLDWYVVYTDEGAQAIDVQLMNTSTTTACAPALDVYTADGATALGGTRVDKDTIGHVRYTAPRAEKVGIRVRSQCAGGSYALRVEPPGALSQDEPSDKIAAPVAACKNARNSVKRYLALVKKRNKELKKAKSKAGKKRAKARRKSAGRLLENARDRVVRDCDQDG